MEAVERRAPTSPRAPPVRLVDRDPVVLEHEVGDEVREHEPDDDQRPCRSCGAPAPSARRATREPSAKIAARARASPSRWRTRGPVGDDRHGRAADVELLGGVRLRAARRRAISRPTSRWRGVSSASSDGSSGPRSARQRVGCRVARCGDEADPRCACARASRRGPRGTRGPCARVAGPGAGLDLARDDGPAKARVHRGGAPPARRPGTGPVPGASSPWISSPWVNPNGGQPIRCAGTPRRARRTARGASPWSRGRAASRRRRRRRRSRGSGQSCGRAYSNVVSRYTAT